MPCPVVFHVVGLRADGSHQTIGSLFSRDAAETLVRVAIRSAEFSELEIIDADEPPPSAPPTDCG